MIIVHFWTDLTSDDAGEAMERLTVAMAGSGYACEMEVHALSTSPALQAVYAAKAAHADPVAAARGGVAASRALRAAHEAGANIGDPQVLVSLAGELGVDPGELAAGLEEGRWLGPVETDVADARRVHATEPPFVIIGGLFMASGLKPTAEYADLVATAGRALGEAEERARAEVDEVRRGDPAP